MPINFVYSKNRNEFEIILFYNDIRILEDDNFQVYKQNIYSFNSKKSIIWPCFKDDADGLSESCVKNFASYPYAFIVCVFETHGLCCWWEDDLTR